MMIACEEETSSEMTAGEMTSGEMTAGEMPAGEMTAGEMPAGEMPAGEMTNTEFSASEPYERDVEFGWIAAGQPSEERLRALVEMGVRIISLRATSEEPFDEEALVNSLEGTFIRYPTSGSDYESVAFREAMYDLYDQQIELGGPVYLHCASSNRVGASWALYHAERLNFSDEEALAIGQAAGLAGLESLVLSILEAN